MSDALLGQLDRFAIRNSFLHAVLGLRSLSVRSQALVRDAATTRPTDASDGDAELRLAILGALSLAEQVQSHLAAAVEGAAPSGGAPLRPTPQRLRDLLR